MEKKMFDLKVKSWELPGVIAVEQDEQESLILLHVDQIPLLIEWLKEAANAKIAEDKGRN